MQKASELRSGWRRNVVIFLAALLVVVADQLIKIWVRSNIPVGESLFKAGFFQLTHVRNTGAAFGLFQGQSFLLSIVALIAISLLLVYILVLYRRSPFLDNVPERIAIGLVLGGTTGNLIDRLRFGYVTDFVDFGLWPAFNVADSAVTVGVILFAFSLLSVARVGRH